MIDKKRAIKYCKNDISLIENYDKAIADNSRVWHCHHRRETIFSRKDLIEIGEYYNRPACELIFLTKSEHMKLHNLGKSLSEETRKKLSESNKGKHLSAETRQKLSEANKGKPSCMKSKHLSAETRQKLSEARKGKHHSEETRKKMSEALKGKPSCIKGNHWYNNGVKSIRAKTCPEGFVPGRIVCNKRA